MRATLYKEDYRDSGWFELLKELDFIDDDVEYHDLFSDTGDIKTGSPYFRKYASYFMDNVALELDIREVTVQGL